MNSLITRLTVLATVLLSAIALTGCGDPTAASTSSGKTSPGAAGKLTHADGAIALSGSTLTLTPASGDAKMTFQLGPAVQKGTVQALVAANTRARVFYSSATKTSPVLAAAVEAAPIAGAGSKSYAGLVVSATPTEITIAGKDGNKTFPIMSKDLNSFDIPHLNEHKRTKEPLRIYYMPKEGNRAVADEDA
ncbi:MAG: hypothetical protein ABI200_05800 [Gaiellales bacterium]